MYKSKGLSLNHPFPPTMPRSSSVLFSIGMSAISLMIATVVFLLVTRVAVFRNTWAGEDLALSNITGVSLFFLHHRASLTIVFRKLCLFGDLRLNLDARTSSVSWAVIVCDPQTAPADRLIPNDTRMLARCKPPSVALDVYITRYAGFSRFPTRFLPYLPAPPSRTSHTYR